jgi:RNA polymerase sigma-70 factor (ECF subfamily)
MDAALPDCEVARLQSDNVAERNLAWRELYDANFSNVYRLICRSGVMPSEAEDLCQKVFLVAHRKLPDTRELHNVSGWLYGIALRVVREHYRWHRVRRAKAWLLPDAPGTAPGETASPEHSAERGHLQGKIGFILGRMSTKLRDVLVLLDIEDLRPQEAAEILGIPVNTVRSRRRLAHEEFRRCWQEVVGEGDPS